jgi:dipeptidase
LEVADVLRFDRDSMWIAFNYVANYAMLKYSYMIKDIRAEQGRFEARGFGGRQEVEARALALWESGDEQGARRLLSEHSAALADELLAAWWQLADHLYITYNDGYINTTETIAQPVFYPSWWLEAVGYQNGPQAYEQPATR